MKRQYEGSDGDGSCHRTSLNATTLVMGETEVDLAVLAGEPGTEVMPTLMPEHCIRKYLDLAELTDEEWRALGQRKSFGIQSSSLKKAQVQHVGSL